MGFPCSLDKGKKSAYNAGEPGSVPGSEDPLEKGEVTHASNFGLPAQAVKNLPAIRETWV